MNEADFILIADGNLIIEIWKIFARKMCDIRASPN